MAWRRDECGNPKASEWLEHPSSSHPPTPPLGCLAAGPGLAWEDPCQPGAWRQGAGVWAGPTHVAAWPRPQASAAPSSPPRPPSSSVLAPRSTLRPREPARGSFAVSAHAPQSLSHGFPHASASLTSARSFPLARPALGRGGSGRTAPAGRPTMEADGAGEQMRPLLTRVTRRVRAAGLLGRRARGAADKGWGAAGQPQVPSRAPPPQAAGAPGQPLCVTARSWGRAARRQGGRRGGPAARCRHPGCRVPGSRHPGGPAARGLGRSTAERAPPPLRGARLSFPAFSPPGLGSSGLGAGLEVRPSINPSSPREEERGPTWLSHRPW